MVSEETVRKKSPKVAYLELYDALERKLKQHAPRDYITWMSKRLSESWLDDKKFIQAPPHKIMHSIEANCAYWKRGYRKPVTWEAIVGIMNVYHDFVDTYQLNTISESFERFFLMMDREQIPLQNRPSWDPFLRSWILFAREDAMTESRHEFYKLYNITMDQWVKVCMICWMISLQEAGTSFIVKMVENPKVKISQEMLENFLKYSARSPEEIGRYFLDMRKNESYEYHSFIRSCFFETPIVKFSDDSLIVPHTHLLFFHAGEGLYRLAHTLDMFADEFSDSFMKYIQKVLNSLEGVINFINSKQMMENATGKSCDYLVETKDTIILIECKACSFTANRLTNNAIENNSSTGQVAKGIVQLYSSAKDLENGRLKKFGVDHNKTTIGMVVTFGKIPLANSEWYFEKFFRKRADEKLNEVIYPSRQMTRRPIVLDISVFEKLITILNSDRKTLQEIYDKKQEEEYNKVGDWETWLSSQHDSGRLNLPKFLQEARTEFCNELGIPDEISDSRGDTENKIHIAQVARVPNNSPT